MKNQHDKTFYDKLTYIYLELPNFNLAEDLLTTRLNKCIYFIKLLEDFQTIPIIFRDEVFSQAFEKAELAKYDSIELNRYQNSLKIYRDNKAVYETAIETAFGNGYQLHQWMSKGKLEKNKIIRYLN